MKITIGAINEKPGSSKKYKTGSWRTLKPVLIPEKCKKCWICYHLCPEGCITKNEEGPKTNYDYCKGCGICAYECPFDAIIMELEKR
jgi:2-oxoacid:acceptor oxidoreductase delta subunit (pyruvate/2-ketoisovalerate family)